MDQDFNKNLEMDLRYEVTVKFTAEELHYMHYLQGQHAEEAIDFIGEGIKSEMRHIHETRKR